MGIHAWNRDARLARIYCDGVIAQKAGDLISTNPWDATQEAQQRAAWDAGHIDAARTAGDAVDLSCCGFPAAGEDPPEVKFPGRY